MAPDSSLELTEASMVDATDATLDLEAVIARFADDDSRVSHALPASLSPEQRQLAKKLVEHHAHIACESYGFGPERQLHLFKKRTGCNGVRMRVKNTFIDAWLEGADGKVQNAPVIRSWPSNQRSVIVAALVSTVPDKHDTIGQEVVAICSTPSSCTSPKLANMRDVLMLGQINDENLDKSNINRDAPICSTPSPCTSPLGASSTGMQGTLEARDPNGTEIATSTQSKKVDDEGLSPIFKTAPSPPPVSPSNVEMLSRGALVEIDGLLQRPDFNGLSGVVQAWDPLLRRYDVLLDSLPGGSGPRHVKTKRENLRLRPPPPPLSAADHHAATIDLDSCLPFVNEETCQVGSELLPIDASSFSPTTMSDNSWVPWQFCEAGTTHDWNRLDTNADDSNNHSEDAFGGSWSYNASVLPYNDGVLSFESPDSAGWHTSLCDTSMDSGSGLTY